MKQVFGSTWAFIKIMKWHLLLSPVYAYMGLWFWNLAVLLPCLLLKLDWGFEWACKMIAFGELVPDDCPETFPLWHSAICLLFALAGYTGLRLFRSRHPFFRSALAAFGVLAPVGAGIQMLNVVFLHRNRGGFTGTGDANVPLFWIFTCAWCLIMTWLAVREIGRNEPRLARFRSRAVSTILTLLVIFFFVRIFYYGDDFWPVRKVRHLIKKAEITREKGPLAAEMYAFKNELSRLDNDSARKRRLKDKYFEKFRGRARYQSLHRFAQSARYLASRPLMIRVALSPEKQRRLWRLALSRTVS